MWGGGNLGGGSLAFSETLKTFADNKEHLWFREEREMNTQVTLPRFTIEKEIDLKVKKNRVNIYPWKQGNKD